MTSRPWTVGVAFWLMVAQLAVIVVPPITFNIAVIIINAVVLWLAWRVRGGANWARIIRSIGAVSGLVWVAVSVATSAFSTAEILTYGLLYVVDAAAVLLLWLPKSNAYFRAVAAEKRAFVG
jgi:hypothetical protein